ncbi:MAG TPA: hypothetical protein VMG74_10830, partial [Gaiellaceae bacterium]|nr:hypothetical protein [Gaiellaceae bacterium]
QLTATTIAITALGIALPYIPPLAHLFGFTPLPAKFLGILAAMTLSYLALVQFGVGEFFRPKPTSASAAPTVPSPALRPAA